MAKAIDYLKWRGDITFEASGMNEVDALIFSQLVYVEFDDIIPKRGTITIAKAWEKFKKRHRDTEIEAEKYVRKKAIDTFREAAATARFASLKLSHFVKDTNLDEDSQFCAMMIAIDDETVVVDYRGTDGTVVGWKENFTLGYMPHTIGQQKSVGFIEKCIKPQIEKIYVTGHSKGGNLAMYAAAFCDSRVSDRIETIYNFDGPGFLDNVIGDERYKRIVPKIKTFIPETSIVGRLLWHSEQMNVVESSVKGFNQHDQLTWQLVGTKLTRIENTDSKSQFVDSLLKNWMEVMDDSQLETFVQTLFESLERQNIETLDDLSQMKLAQWRDLYKAGSELSKENQGILGTAMHLLLNTGGRQVLNVIKPSEEE